MNLRALDLSNNEIERIENLGALKQLRVLKLNANRIRKIENISVLKNLEVLELSHNFVEDIPALISLNKHVGSFNLSSNNIQKKELILNLRPCAKLNELFLNGNPLSHSPDYLAYVQSSLRQLKVLDGQIIAPNSAFKKSLSPNPVSNTNEVKRPRNNQNSEVNFDDACEMEGTEDSKVKNYFLGTNCSFPSNGAAQMNQKIDTRAAGLESQTSSNKPSQTMYISALELKKDIMTDEQFSGRYIQQTSDRESHFDELPDTNQSSRRRNISLEEINIVTQLSNSKSHKKQESKPVETKSLVSPKDTFQHEKQITSLQSYQSLKKVLDLKEMQTPKETKANDQSLKPEKHQSNRIGVPITNYSLQRQSPNAIMQKLLLVNKKTNNQNCNDRENNLFMEDMKDERRRVSLAIGDLTNSLAQYQLEADESSKTYDSTTKDIEFIKEECLALMKKINAWLESHINEGASNEYDSDSTRLVLLNERSEIISRIKEFLRLLDSEIEYHMNYFLLALKTRCEKAELSLRKMLNKSMSPDQTNSHEGLENEEQTFQAIVKELGDNYMELEKLSVRVLQIRENLSARILKGFSLEKRYFTTLTNKLSELQDKERLRMSLFAELNENCTKIYDIIQRIRMYHQKGLQIDDQIGRDNRDNNSQENGFDQEITVKEWNVASDFGRKEFTPPQSSVSSSVAKDMNPIRLSPAQNRSTSAKSRYHDPKQYAVQPQARTPSLDTDATTKSHDFKKAGSSQNTSCHLGVVLNESMHSQQVPDHLGVDRNQCNREEDDENQSEQMEEEQLSANWGSNDPDSNSYNEYYLVNTANCRSEEFLPSTLKPQNKQKSSSLTVNLLQKQEAYTMECPTVLEIPDTKPDLSTFLKSIHVSESPQCQEPSSLECKPCKIKEQDIASLTSRVEKANVENNKLASNMQELCKTLDEVRESFENALRQQAASYETKLNQKNTQNEQLTQSLNRLLDESQCSSQKIEELKSSLDSIYAAFSQGISNTNGIQKDLPWILKTQAIVIESLIAQRASLEKQYRDSLQLNKELVEAGNYEKKNDAQHIDLIISIFFNPKREQSLLTIKDSKEPFSSREAEAQENLVLPILNQDTTASAPSLKISNSHHIYLTQKERRIALNQSSGELSERKEKNELLKARNDSETSSQKAVSNIQTRDVSTTKIENKSARLENKPSYERLRFEENQNHKIPGSLSPLQDNRTVLNQIVSALPQPRVLSIQRRLEETDLDQKKRQQNVNRLSFADRQVFTLNTHAEIQGNENDFFEANSRNYSKILEPSQSQNSVHSPSSRSSSSRGQPSPTLPAEKQRDSVNLRNQTEQLSTSSPNLSKALFGTKSAEKENNKEITNETTHSFLLSEIPISALDNEDIPQAKLKNSNSVPIIFNRLTGNLPGFLSNLHENIAQNVYQKTPQKPQAGLLNLHINAVHYRDFKGKQNQSRSKQNFIQKKIPAQNLNTSSNSSKNDVTPIKECKLTLVSQLSAQDLANFKPQKALSGHKSVTNLLSSNQLNTSQTGQPTQAKHSTIDQSQVFRKNSNYTAKGTREISINLQTFLDHKRRMFDTPDIANYSDRFDITSPYHPLYAQSVHEQPRSSTNASFKQSGLTSRSISREATNRVNSPANERMDNSFQSSRQENRANPKGKTHILNTVLGSKKRRCNYH